MPPADPIDFFAQAKARSLHKLDLFAKYLAPLSYKWGSRIGRGRKGWRHVWVVDAFAGAGAYQPAGGGRVQDGSPLIAAKWAKRLAIERRYPVVKCLNVERDETCFAELERNLAPWKDVATCLGGTFAEQLDAILATVADDPVFFFLDPFGINGIEMDTVQRLIERRGKTELLVHFSDRTFLRMAGHLSETGERVSVSVKVAEAKLARLDAVMGTKRWRLLWARRDVDTDAAMEGTVSLYLEQLRERGMTHAHQVRIRDRHSDKPSYRLVFCTRSAHGIDLMSDIACRYERGLAAEEAAGALTLWHETEERQRLTDLRDRLYAAGLQRQTATREELVHELAPQLFGQHLRSEFARAVRELVETGLITRASSAGIEEREPLRFVEPPQGSLLSQEL